MHILTRSRRRRRFVGAGLALGVAAAVAVGQPASAHVAIAEEEVEAGSSAILTFVVPHGCDDSPTTQIRIQMPESIPTVTPTVNANWDAEKVTEDLETPIEGSHGEQLTERVSEVVYSARTPLADGFRDTFELSVKIPPDAAGEPLFFPTIQTCETGETAWIEIPEEGQGLDELESPAPGVMVVAPAEDDDHEATATTAG